MEELTRKPGRPKKGEQVRDEPKPAQPVELPSHVPPQICVHCGRGMQPRIIERINNSEHGPMIKCSCSLCGGKFDYRPAAIFRRV
jgi:hypothetical protein